MPASQTAAASATASSAWRPASIHARTRVILERRGPRSVVLGGGGERRLPTNKGLEVLSRFLIAELLRRRLHEVRRGLVNRAGEPAVERQLRTAHGVDNHARGVRAVPDLELRLEHQRDIAEGRALDADVAPLAVLEPGNVVRGADVDVGCGELVLDLRRHGIRLGDLLRLESLAL